MGNNSDMRRQLAGLLSRRRNYQMEIKQLTDQYRYVVFYGCGAILNSIVETWKEYVGREIDYCCDSDSSKWGKYFCGARCISPKELLTLKHDCAVFITIGEFHEVFKFLTENGFPSVNLIYKYDLVTSDFLANHEHGEVVSKLCQTYDYLSDQQSRIVFDAIINRVAGNGKTAGIMSDVCEGNQYFPADIIELSEHESFVDIGAFNGDTVKDFIERTRGKFDAVFSFEVDEINFASLEATVGPMASHHRIEIFNFGIWDSECDITYSIGSSQSTVGSGEGKGRVVPLDSILRNERITFIKMDIEGAEPRALRGARDIITAQKPKLAICVYHDFRHLWEIPLYLKKLVPEYKIFLRHHTSLEYETVCYAVP